MAGRDEQPAELRIGTFSLTVLRLFSGDAAAMQAYLADQVAQAPGLLTGAAILLDPFELDPPDDTAVLDDLLTRIRFCGLQPIALVAEPESAWANLADSCRLPVVNPERKRVSRTEARTDVTPETVSNERSKAGSADANASTHATQQPNPGTSQNVTPISTMQYQHSPVRSGQQLYAKGCDLAVLAQVSAGAEVIADGSIHVYGRLAGKAIAGAKGAADARIFCLGFQAELVSIAGRYRVFEAIPEEWRDRPCQLYLQGDKLEIQVLGS